MGFRFRVDEGKLVLQVLEEKESHGYGWPMRGEWRDATVGDIPVVNPFQQVEYRYPEQVYSPHRMETTGG